jgi:hypothetical protein
MDPDIISCVGEIVDQHCTGCGAHIDGAEDGDECPFGYYPDEIKRMKEFTGFYPNE